MPDPMTIADQLTANELRAYSNWLFFVVGLPLSDVVRLVGASEDYYRLYERSRRLLSAWLVWRSTPWSVRGVAK